MKLSDYELMNKIGASKQELDMFRKVQQKALKEVNDLSKAKKGKIKVLGISGSARSEFDTSQENSNSEFLLEECLKECKKLGADVEIIKLRDYDIKYCKACYSTVNTQCHFYCSCYPKGKQGDDMTNIIYDKLLSAEAIIFATPVNNMSTSSLMKLFLDRCISLDGSLSPANPKTPKDKKLNIKHMKFIELTADNNIPGSGMLRRFYGKVAGVITTGHEEGASLAISTLFMTLNHWGMIFPPISNSYAMASICNGTYEDKPLVTNECNKKLVRELAENVVTMTKLARTKSFKDWKYDYGSN